MKNLENMELVDLAKRLNEIRWEQDKLEIEHNQIIKEIWNRIPSLKDDENLQPKTKTK